MPHQPQPILSCLQILQEGRVSDGGSNRTRDCRHYHLRHLQNVSGQQQQPVPRQRGPGQGQQQIRKRAETPTPGLPG